MSYYIDLFYGILIIYLNAKLTTKLMFIKMGAGGTKLPIYSVKSNSSTACYKKIFNLFSVDAAQHTVPGVCGIWFYL